VELESEREVMSMGRRGFPTGKEVEEESEESGGFRVPSIIMVPVGASVGWLVAGWLGAIFGGVIGIFLWRSRP